MVVMLDVDFLASPSPFNGVLLYRYRSGILRRSLKKCLDELALRSGGVLIPCDPVELASFWGSGGLIDGIRVCDLSASQSASKAEVKALMALFEKPPGAPTAIFLRASSAEFNHLSKSCGVLLDEAVLTVSNIDVVLSFLDDRSELTPSGKLTKQGAFQKYFRRWIEERGTAAVPDLIQEYDRSVLLFADLKSDEFTPPQDEEGHRASPSYLVRSLRRLLASMGPFETVDLLRALSRKQQRGWSDQDLAGELCGATQKVLRNRKNGNSGGYFAPLKPISITTESSKIADEALALWTAMLLVWAGRFEGVPSVSVDRKESHFLVDVDHLCRDYGRRRKLLKKDPLVGCWSALSDVLGGLSTVDGEASDPRAHLLQSLLQLRHSPGSYNWLDKVYRLATQLPNPQEAATAVSRPPRSSVLDPSSIAQLVGQEKAIRELQNRFVNDDHSRPLMLVGPLGVGKRTLARIYAKALLCEGDLDRELTPCRNCSSCATFETTAGGFGYVELDVGHPEALSHVRDSVQKLRYVSFSKRRIVVLKNSDAAPEPIDAMLKTLEEGTANTTFIALARNEHSVRATALSRSAVYRLRALQDADARSLITRWLPSGSVQDQVFDLIVMCGLGLPGPMLRLCAKVLQASASTLDEAKSVCGLDWGEEALRYWHALLADHDPLGTLLELPDAVSPQEAVRHAQVILHRLGTAVAPNEPALLGSGRKIEEIWRLLDERALQIGVPHDHLWKKLTHHWLGDAVVDAQSFLEAGLGARDLLSGQVAIADE